jgi:hypothetical protein
LKAKHAAELRAGIKHGLAFLRRERGVPKPTYKYSLLYLRGFLHVTERRVQKLPDVSDDLKKMRQW